MTELRSSACRLAHSHVTPLGPCVRNFLRAEQERDEPQPVCASQNGIKGRTSEVHMACLHSAGFGQKWESVKVSVKGMVLSRPEHFVACFVTLFLRSSVRYRLGLTMYGIK